MNRDYMLRVLKARITELENSYRQYFDQTTGPSKSYMGAACMRSRIRKDLSTLHLLQYFLMHCPDSMTMVSEELTNAFDRLTEPRKHK